MEEGNGNLFHIIAKKITLLYGNGVWGGISYYFINDIMQVTWIMLFTQCYLLTCDITVACNRYLSMNRFMRSSGWFCLGLKTNWTQACLLVLSSTLDSDRKGIIHLAPTCVFYTYCDFSRIVLQMSKGTAQSQRRCSLFMDFYIGLIKCHSMDQSTFFNLDLEP